MNTPSRKQEISAAPTVSIRPYRDGETGAYNVELFVRGLRTAEMAEKLADMLAAFVAGDEIEVN